MKKNKIVGLESVINKYYTIERQIREVLSNLLNYGKECDCQTNIIETIELIEEDGTQDRFSMKTVVKYCIKCGGRVEEN